MKRVVKTSCVRKLTSQGKENGATEHIQAMTLEKETLEGEVDWDLSEVEQEVKGRALWKKDKHAGKEPEQDIVSRYAQEEVIEQGVEKGYAMNKRETECDQEDRAGVGAGGRAGGGDRAGGREWGARRASGAQSAISRI